MNKVQGTNGTGSGTAGACPGLSQRRRPVLLQAQQLSLEERGGISFERDYVA